MSKFLKGLKITCMSLLLVGGSLLCTHTTAFAATDSYEPNDTIDQAVSISRNIAQDADQPIKKIDSYIQSAGDEDWYKVFLDKGEQTLTLQAGNPYLDVEVIESDKKTAALKSTTFSRYSQQQIKFKATESGIYYIHITGNNGSYGDASKDEYSLSVGNPYYTTRSYTKKLNQSIPVYGKNQYSSIASFDLSKESSIPDEAVVTSVTIGGTESPRGASGRVRSIKPYSTDNWIDTKEYLFENSQFSPSLKPIALKQQWQFKHKISSFGGRNTSYSLNPTIMFRYRCEMFK